jgi:hypothetical protein
MENERGREEEGNQTVHLFLVKTRELSLKHVVLVRRLGSEWRREDKPHRSGEIILEKEKTQQTVVKEKSQSQDKQPQRKRDTLRYCKGEHSRSSVGAPAPLHQSRALEQKR